MSASREPIISQRSQLPRPARSLQVRMWLNLTGGGFAWTFHLMASAVVSEWGAIAGLGDRMILGVNLIAWAIIVITGLSLVAALWATWQSARLVRLLQNGNTQKNSVENREPSGLRYQSLDAAYLMAVGFWANCVFLLVIVAQFLPVFYYWGAG